MKEFNLEEAKAGKPVCTRDGKPVRIICFDRKDQYNTFPIVALVLKLDGNEVFHSYTNNGKFMEDTSTSDLDLMMAGKKHEGWVNIYREGYSGDTKVSFAHYSSKEAAIEVGKNNIGYITTIKIEWEE